MREQCWKIYQGQPLPYGVQARKNKINFSMVVKGSAALELCDNTSGMTVKTIDLQPYKYADRLYAVTVETPDWKKLGYRLISGGIYVDDAWAAGVKIETAEEEPFYTIETDEFNWGADKEPNLPFENLYIYKLHVKGFTQHPSSKVRCKGTFSGVTEKLPYLKDLGINALELMPVYNFNREIKDKTSGIARDNYWGYGPGQFMAPNPEYGKPEELKQLIKQAHEMGMEIYLELLFPADMWDILKLDILRHWTLRYHVDGFHIGQWTSPMNIILKEPLLSGKKIMSEGFNGFEASDISSGRTAVYHNGYLETTRHFLKGDRDSLAPWMNQMLERRNGGLIRYITNNNGFTMMDLVSYNEKHNEDNGEENRDGSDENISFNCGVEGASRKNKVSALRKKQLKNAWLLNLFHQGTPVIYAGDEMCNSQMGNNNAWCQDNDISWLNWNITKTKDELHTFAKKMIGFRKSFPMFHPSKSYRMMDVDGLGYPDFSFHGRQPWFVENSGYDKCIGCMYTSRSDGEKLKCCYFAYNMSAKPEIFYLPTLPEKTVWHMLTDTSKETGDSTTIVIPDKGYSVEEHSIVIFESK